MTATGRGAERVDLDAYPTPSWCVRRLLEAVDLPLELPAERGTLTHGTRGARWLEPCAGDGAIIRAANAYCTAAGKAAEIFWHANELRPEMLPLLRDPHLSQAPCQGMLVDDDYRPPAPAAEAPKCGTCGGCGTRSIDGAIAPNLDPRCPDCTGKEGGKK